MTTDKINYTKGLSPARYENAALFIGNGANGRLFSRYCESKSLSTVLAENLEEAVGTTEVTASNSLDGIVGRYAKKNRFFPFVVHAGSLAAGKELEAKLRNSFGNASILPPQVYLLPHIIDGIIENNPASLIKSVAKLEPANMQTYASILSSNLRARFPMQYGDRVLLVHGGKKEIKNLGNDLIAGGVFLESIHSAREALEVVKVKAKERNSFPIIISGKSIEGEEKSTLPLEITHLVQRGEILEPFFFDGVHPSDAVLQAYSQIRALNQ